MGTTVSCWKASPLSEKVCWRRPLLAASVRAVVTLAASPGRARTSTWASTKGDTACRGLGNSESARLQHVWISHKAQHKQQAQVLGSSLTLLADFALCYRQWQAQACTMEQCSLAENK